MKLSLCLTVYNEASNIHYPLDSCIDWVDEVVIVDGGSTDKTVKIAKSYGKKIRIIKTHNPKMFHINKQKSISAAKGEWILQLDADEAISDQLRSEIEFKIQSSKFKIEDTFVAYYIPRKNFFIGRFLMKGGQYPDYTIRLYKNGVAKFPCKDVHENVVVKGKVGYLKNPINHYSYPSFSRYINRWKRYTALEAIRLKEQGEKKDIIRLIDYLIVKPVATFFLMYFRHLGFLDGWQGFVFAFFSSIRFPIIYLLYIFPNNQ